MINKSSLLSQLFSNKCSILYSNWNFTKNIIYHARNLSRNFCSEPNHTNENDLKKMTLEFLVKASNSSELDSKFIPLLTKKDRGPGYATNAFKDHVNIKVKAGTGGDGASSLLRTYRKEYGGPDGGDGGNGGHVVFKATHAHSSLCHLPLQISASCGDKGKKKEQYGKDAEHSIIGVPLGTIVKHDGDVIASLDVEGAMYVAAKGGAGGKGNMFFTTDTSQAPIVAEHGGTGEEFSYEVELRTMADVGLIGFPNAGKSTLLRAISRARPKVASYPFTTLNPHVGVVQYTDLVQLAVADIPGLVENAHRNKGLGHSFLKHIQRCSSLLYVLDVSQPEPWKQLDILRYELEKYESGLSERPHAIVANKVDVPEAYENIKELERRLDMPVVSISAKYGKNLTILLALIRWLTERHDSKLILEQQYSGSDWIS